MGKISVVVNTLNEEKNLGRLLASVKDWADEIVVVDMFSDDQTQKIAKDFGAKVFTHRKTGYVEPARNFAISKAKGDWILIMDADEEVPSELAKRFQKIALSKNTSGFFRIPRRNIVFNKWLKHSRWWPDYNIRFFKKGVVTWNDEIHSVPITRGEGQDLPAQERFAIYHHHYTSLTEYLDRQIRYTEIQAKERLQKGEVFSWTNLLRKPLGEFLSRFFAGEGYKDGVHGLVVAMLQAFVEVITLARIWETQKFSEEELNKAVISKEVGHAAFEIDHWLQASGIRKYSKPEKLLRKLLSHKK